MKKKSEKIEFLVMLVTTASIMFWSMNTLAQTCNYKVKQVPTVTATPITCGYDIQTCFNGDHFKDPLTTPLCTGILTLNMGCGPLPGNPPINVVLNNAILNNAVSP